MEEIMFFALIALVSVIGVLYGLVKLIQIFTHKDTPRPHITVDKIKQTAVMLAIMILLPIFINLTAGSVFPESDMAGSFVFAIIASLGALVAGFSARHNRIVGSGLTLGGLLGIIYAVSIRFPSFTATIKAAIAGSAVLLSIAFAYWYSTKPDRTIPTQSALHGFKAVITGLLIYFFAMVFLVNLNAALNPSPKYPVYPLSRPITKPVPLEGSSSSSPVIAPEYDTGETQRQYDDFTSAQREHERNTFIIVLALSSIYLIIGVLVRGVSAVSVALIAAGITSILYTLTLSYNEIGRNAMALVSGIAVIGFIALAYWKFGASDNDTPPPQPPRTGSSTKIAENGS